MHVRERPIGVEFIWSISIVPAIDSTKAQAQQVADCNLYPSLSNTNPLISVFQIDYQCLAVRGADSEYAKSPAQALAASVRGLSVGSNRFPE